jgi:hypothetical protein
MCKGGRGREAAAFRDLLAQTGIRAREWIPVLRKGVLEGRENSAQ